MKTRTIVIVGVVMVAGLFFFASCGKKDDGRDGHDANAMGAMEHPTASESWTCSMHPEINEPKAGKCPLCGMKLIPRKADTTTITQTTCPVMDNPINKDIFVEYKGKKVYFCCDDCVKTFNKDPEKYINNLK